MENLNTLETSMLIDMLAEHTRKYTQMMTEGGDNEEYEKCKLAIAAIQKEIETRKQAFDDNSTATTEPPGFTF